MAKRSAPELFKRLASKARRGARAVNVEDLVPLAAARDPAMAEQVEDLAREWPRRGRVEGSAARVAPMGRWADYVCAALEGGPPAVVTLARNEGERVIDAEDGIKEGSIALGVLAAIRTEEGVQAVLALAADAASDLDGRGALAIGCAGALNELTALQEPVAVSEETAARARLFLHALLERPLATAELAIACCALRGVGDQSSLALVARLPPLPPPWAETPGLAARAIRSRLRTRGAAR